MKRSYENALKLLDSQRRTARPKSPAAPSAHLASTTPSGIVTVKGLPSLAGMKEWLQALGHSEQDVDDLNIIHVAGTKGKGSTCAFTRSFLSAHGLRTGFPKRVGLYTSPHLQSTRERIQIDGEPIAEDLFTRYFFEVWERLVSAESNQLTGIERKPRYLQLLALLAFHTFIKENVDAAVFETHHGGHYDTTNVIRKPVVTGITSLGMDHIAELGPTIEDIAWHKAGIFKPNVLAYSVMQDAGPSEVLRQRAAEKNTELKFVSASSTLPSDRGALSVPVQRLNCSLALQMASSFALLKNPGHMLDEDDVSKGIDGFSWIGRFEIINKGTSQWFLDGAHNQLSLSQAAGWFSKNANESSNVPKYRVLIFSHFSEARDGVPLVECLAQALSEFNAEPDHVIFTTYQEREDGSTRIDNTQKVPENPFPDLCSIYSSLWKDAHPNAAVSTEPTIEGAIKLAERISAERDGVQAFVTGSLYLVGGALRILRP